MVRISLQQLEYFRGRLLGRSAVGVTGKHRRKTAYQKSCRCSCSFSVTPGTRRIGRFKRQLDDSVCQLEKELTDKAILRQHSERFFPIAEVSEEATNKL